MGDVEAMLGPKFAQARREYYRDVGDLAAVWIADGVNTPERCAAAAAQEVLKRRRELAEKRSNQLVNVFDIRRYRKSDGVE